MAEEINNTFVPDPETGLPVQQAQAQVNESAPADAGSVAEGAQDGNAVPPGDFTQAEMMQPQNETFLGTGQYEQSLGQAWDVNPESGMLRMPEPEGANQRDWEKFNAYQDKVGKVAGNEAMPKQEDIVPTEADATQSNSETVAAGIPKAEKVASVEIGDIRKKAVAEPINAPKDIYTPEELMGASRRNRPLFNSIVNQFKDESISKLMLALNQWTDADARDTEKKKTYIAALRHVISHKYAGKEVLDLNGMEVESMRDSGDISQEAYDYYNGFKEGKEGLDTRIESQRPLTIFAHDMLAYLYDKRKEAQQKAEKYFNSPQYRYGDNLEQYGQAVEIAGLRIKASDVTAAWNAVMSGVNSEKLTGYILAYAKENNISIEQAYKEFPEIVMTHVMNKLVEEQIPADGFDYMLQNLYQNTMLGQIFTAQARIASGVPQGNTTSLTIKQMATQAYIKAHNDFWSQITRAAVSTGTFVLDSLGGGFILPGAVAKGTQKGLLWTTKALAGMKNVTMANAERLLGSSAAFKVASGMAGGAFNFGTYEGMCTLVGNFASDESVLAFDNLTAEERAKREADPNYMPLWKQSVYAFWGGAKKGAVFGLVGGAVGHFTDGLKGVYALGGEAIKFTAEAGSFIGLDYLALKKGEKLTAEQIGGAIGMTLAGKALHPFEYAAEVVSRVNGTHAQLKTVMVKLPDADAEVLRGMGYGNIADLLSRKGGPKKQYDWDAIEEEYNKMSKDENIPLNYERMARWAVNGEFMPVPIMADFKKVRKDDGTYEITRLDSNGRAINGTPIIVKGTEGLKAFENEKHTNRTILCEMKLNESSLEVHRIKSCAAYAAASIGKDVEYTPEQVDALYTNAAEKVKKGEKLSAEEEKLVAGVNMIYASMPVKSAVAEAVKQIEGKHEGISIDKILRKPYQKRTEEEKSIVREYEETLGSMVLKSKSDLLDKLSEGYWGKVAEVAADNIGKIDLNVDEEAVETPEPKEAPKEETKEAPMATTFDELNDKLGHKVTGQFTEEDGKEIDSVLRGMTPEELIRVQTDEKYSEPLRNYVDTWLEGLGYEEKDGKWEKMEPKPEEAPKPEPKEEAPAVADDNDIREMVGQMTPEERKAYKAEIEGKAESERDDMDKATYAAITELEEALAKQNENATAEPPKAETPKVEEPKAETPKADGRGFAESAPEGSEELYKKVEGMSSEDVESRHKELESRMLSNEEPLSKEELAEYAALGERIKFDKKNAPKAETPAPEPKIDEAEAKRLAHVIEDENSTKEEKQQAREKLKEMGLLKTKGTSENPGLVRNEHTDKLTKREQNLLHDAASVAGHAVHAYDSKGIAKLCGISEAEAKNVPGYFDENTGDIYVNTDWSDRSLQRTDAVGWVLGHEMTHAIKRSNDAEVWNSFRDAVRASMGEELWDRYVKATAADRKKFSKDTGIKELDDEKIEEEVLADWAGRNMFTDADAAKALIEGARKAKMDTQGITRKILDYINDKIASLLDLKKKMPLNQQEKLRLANLELAKGIWDAMYKVEAAKATEAKPEPAVSNDGEGNDGIVLSHATYDGYFDNFGEWHEGTREMTIRRMKENGWKDDVINKFVGDMDFWYDFTKKVGDFTTKDGDFKYKEFREWIDHTPKYKEVGGKVVKALSTLVNNGEYPINLELSTDCIKREALTSVFNAIASRGGSSFAAMNAQEMELIKQMMERYGVQKACPLCFVEGKRLGIRNWAQTIVDDWNMALNEALNLGYKRETTRYRNTNGKLKKPTERISPKDLADMEERIGAFKFYEGDGITDVVTEQELKEDARDEWTQSQRRIVNEVYKALSDRAALRDADLKALQRNADAYRQKLLEFETEWMEEHRYEDFDPSKLTEEQKVALEEIAKKGNDSVYQKMVQAIIDHPELRHTLSLNDLIGSKGITNIRTSSGEAHEKLYSLIVSRFGTATPKVVQEAEAYAGEIIMLSDADIAKADKIGGARIFSFSDFDLTKVFDIMQMTFDMAVRSVRAQSYSKEVPYILLFGTTGIKINMSMLPDARPREDLLRKLNACKNKTQREEVMKEIKEYAGLEIDGDNNILGMQFSDSHSIREDFAKQIFHDDKRNADCGAIMVGASVNHSLYACLTDYIRMVIPFHLSGMPTASRDISDVKYYVDATKNQNTSVSPESNTAVYDPTSKQWASIGGKATKDKYGSLDDFNFYENIEVDGKDNLDWDMRQRCAEYIAWCDNGIESKNGKRLSVRPKFWWGINADNYIRYCESQGYAPNKQIVDGMRQRTTTYTIDGKQYQVFDGYYKMVTDYNPYKPIFDEKGEMIGEEAVPHRKVTANIDRSPETLRLVFGEDGSNEESMLGNRESSLANARKYNQEMADHAIEYLNSNRTKKDKERLLSYGTGETFKNASDSELYMREQQKEGKSFAYITGGTDISGFDKQGNPVDESGKLLVEKIQEISELKDDDFEVPHRTVALPELPKNTADAIGLNGRPVFIKKNIFEKNKIRHPELSASESRNVLYNALYQTNLVGTSQPITRPNYRVAVHTSERNSLVVLDVYQNRDNIDIVGWRKINEEGLIKLIRQSRREGGQFLILSPNDGSAAALSALPSRLSSEDKVTDSSSNMQEDVANITNNSEVIPTEDVDKGIYINVANQDYIEQILNGDKTIETRFEIKGKDGKGPLDSLVGKRVALIATGNGKQKVMGYVTIADKKLYENEDAFRADENQHKVSGGEYDVANGNGRRKIGYVLENPVREETPYETEGNSGHTIRNSHIGANGSKTFSHVTPEQDKDYLDAVEKGDTKAAERMVRDAAAKAMVNPAKNEKGEMLDLYHGTPNFGFTKFKSHRTSGAIFTVDNRTVSANYGKDGSYASVRKINKPVNGGTDTQSVINDAKNALDQDWRTATTEERESFISKIETDAKTVAAKLDELAEKANIIEDADFDMLNATAYVHDIIYTAAYARENGNEGNDLSKLLSDAYKKYKENKQVVSDYVYKHYDELDADTINYLHYLTGYKLGDIAIYAGHSMSVATKEGDVLTVDGKSFMTVEDMRSIIDNMGTNASYHLYGDLGSNPLTVECKDSNWYSIEFNGKRTSTDDIANWAKENGYTSVVFKSIYDDGDKADVYTFFDNNQIKSADPITYDDNGNVIPLSERFNSEKDDIRFAHASADDTFDIEGIDTGFEHTTLEHRALEAVARLANEHTENKAARNNLMRTVADGLGDIYKQLRSGAVEKKDAMTTSKFRAEANKATNATAATQHEYDRKTISSLVAYARTMHKVGLLKGIGTRDLGSMLIAIRDAANGKGSMEDACNRLFDAMLNTQERNERNILKKQLMVKSTKIDPKGVEVQGKIGVLYQKAIKTINNYMGKAVEDINQRMGEVSNKFTSPDESVVEDAKMEYAGLMLAKLYSDTIRETDDAIVELENSISDLKAQYKAGTLPRPAYSQAVRAVKNAMRERRLESLEAARKVSYGIATMLEEGKAAAKAFAEKELKRVREIHADARKDMEGASASEQTGKGSVVDNWVVNNPLWLFLTRGLNTFEQRLRSFGGKAAGGEGFLFERFWRGIMNARNNEITGRREAIAMLDAKAQELTGGKCKKWVDLNHYADKQNMETFELRYIDGGEEQKITLGQGNLMYLYMTDKQSDGQMKLRAMGIDDEQMEEIKQALNPVFRKLADWVQGEFLPSRRVGYNEVYKRMFGAAMPQVDNYFKLKINQRSRHRNPDEAQFGSQPTPSSITGGIIKRTSNSIPIDLNADAIGTAIECVDEMEHWKSYAEINRDLRTLITDKVFMNQVMNTRSIYGTGQEAWDSFVHSVNDVSGVVDTSKAKGIDKLANTLAKGVTRAKIAFRYFTAFKQMQSVMTFLADVRTDDYFKSLVTAGASYKWCKENLPMLQERIESRNLGDVFLDTSDDKWSTFKEENVQWINKYGMWANAKVDALACAIGAKAAYDSSYRRYKRYGLSDERAHERAVHDAETIYNTTQQSSEAMFLSPIQTERTMANVAVTVFRNSSMGWTRRAVDSMRNLRHLANRKETVEFMTRLYMEKEGLSESQAENMAKRMYNTTMLKSLFGVPMFTTLAPLGWYLFGQLPYLLVSNNDEGKKETVMECVRHAYSGGWTEGLVLGNVYSSLIEAGYAMSEEDGKKQWKYTNLEVLPLLSDIEQIKNKFPNDAWEASWMTFNLLAQSFVGVNPQTFTDLGFSLYDAYEAVVDAAEGNPQTATQIALTIMRATQCPKKQIDNIYIEELGRTAREAQKMTPAEMAQEYARQKRIRQAPLKFLQDEKNDQKTIDNYAKKFEDIFVNSLSEESAGQWMNNAGSKSLNNKIAKKIEEGFYKPTLSKEKEQVAIEEKEKAEGVEKEAKKEKGVKLYESRRSADDVKGDLQMSKLKKMTDNSGVAEKFRSYGGKFHSTSGYLGMPKDQSEEFKKFYDENVNEILAAFYVERWENVRKLLCAELDKEVWVNERTEPISMRWTLDNNRRVLEELRRQRKMHAEWINKALEGKADDAMWNPEEIKIRY